MIYGDIDGGRVVVIDNETSTNINVMAYWDGVWDVLDERGVTHLTRGLMLALADVASNAIRSYVSAEGLFVIDRTADRYVNKVPIDVVRAFVAILVVDRDRAFEYLAAA